MGVLECLKEVQEHSFGFQRPTVDVPWVFYEVARVF